MVVEVEGPIEPDHMEYIFLTVAYYWGFGAKSKSNEVNVDLNMGWNWLPE
jgi:hypothetical protein